MTLDPFFAAPGVVQFHMVSAFVGLAVGPFALFRNRRDKIHKTLGYVWIIAMLSLAISALFIKSDIALIAHFGPIHFFSVFTIWGLAEGLWYVRRGDIAKHRASMQSVFFGAMGLAGLFTFLPGRTMNRIMFGGPSDLGWVIIIVGVAFIAVGWRKRVAGPV